MSYNIENLKYIILSGKFPLNKEAQNLHNQAYTYWYNFWNNVFKENGSNETVNTDNFWRQDRITLLMNENEIVGQHLYSFFYLSSLASQNHTYITKSFTQRYFKHLAEQNVHNVMSMEYLAISPQWRKKNCGISLASVMIGLACQHQKIYDIDALIGPSRSDNKVTSLVTDFGGSVITSGLVMHNTPVDLIAIFAEKSKFHPEFSVNMLIRKLWNQRLDYTQSLPAQRKNKVA